MERNYISEVIDTFLHDDFPEETEEKIQQWMIQEEHALEKTGLLREYWDSIHVPASKNTIASLNIVKQKLNRSKDKHESFIPYRYLRIAAILFPLFILAGSYLYFSRIDWKDRYVTVVVPYGAQKHVVLPDGSTIWINAGSSIRYPKLFATDMRTVKLTGEAYFSVTKDSLRAFIVETDHISVRVKGTTFNISAYPDDEKTITTLNSGKVEVRTVSDKTFPLEPNQQFTYNNQTSETGIRRITEDSLSGWRAGQLIFEYTPFPEILRILERKYDVIFEIDKGFYEKNGRFSAKFLNNETIEQVLDVLKDLCGFSYSVRGNTVRLKETSLSR